MRTLVVGDIHGGLKGLIQLLDKSDLQPDDTLIFLGDYVDGWSEAAQVIDYIIELSKTQSCVFIKGNHDVWCEQWLSTGNVNDVWYQHGGKETIESYETFGKHQRKIHLLFFEQMKLYHIDAQNRLFLHAGFTSMHGVEKESDYANFYYDRTLWEMAMAMDGSLSPASKKFPKRFKHYLEIYIGHTPTTNYNITEPVNVANVWNVDTGAAFTGKLSAIDVVSKEVFQSDKLTDLYPDELGRNKN